MNRLQKSLFVPTSIALSLVAGTVLANDLEKKVVIYSTHNEAMLEVVADAFTAQTGVAVDFLNLKGALADRVRAEKNNPQADIMYGGPSSVYMELKNEGLYAPYAPSWSGKIASSYKDADSFWYGTIQTPVMMFYNKNMITAEEAPQDWADLTDAKYQDKLVFRNALSSSARATYSALLQQYEKNGDLNKGWDFLKSLDGNTKQYFGSGSLMFQAIGRQEAAVSFMVLNSIMGNKEKNKLPLEVIDATSGSPVITDGIALLKGAPHPKAAKAFVEFAGNAQTQALLANRFNRLPTNPEALKDSPKWMSTTSFKVMDVDWLDLAAKQSAWMQKWDNEVKASSKDKK